MSSQNLISSTGSQREASPTSQPLPPFPPFVFPSPSPSPPSPSPVLFTPCPPFRFKLELTLTHHFKGWGSVDPAAHSSIPFASALSSHHSERNVTLRILITQCNQWFKLAAQACDGNARYRGQDRLAGWRELVAHVQLAPWLGHRIWTELDDPLSSSSWSFVGVVSCAPEVCICVCALVSLRAPWLGEEGRAQDPQRSHMNHGV